MKTVTTVTAGVIALAWASVAAAHPQPGFVATAGLADGLVHPLLLGWDHLALTAVLAAWAAWNPRAWRVGCAAALTVAAALWHGPVAFGAGVGYIAGLTLGSLALLGAGAAVVRLALRIRRTASERAAASSPGR